MGPPVTPMYDTLAGLLEVPYVWLPLAAVAVSTALVLWTAKSNGGGPRLRTVMLISFLVVGSVLYLPARRSTDYVINAVVALRPITTFSVVGADDVTTKSMRVGAVRATGNPAVVVGRVTLVPVAEGAVIDTTQLLEVKADLPDDPVLVSFATPLELPTGVKPGAAVDLYAAPQPAPDGAQPALADPVSGAVVVDTHSAKDGGPTIVDVLIGTGDASSFAALVGAGNLLLVRTP